jgi:membrane associated rhomboid family serine protease
MTSSSTLKPVLQGSPNSNGLSNRLPVATTVVFAATAVCTAVALWNPALTAFLERTPTMLSRGEIWRLITPVFINPEGWLQRIVNVTGFAAVAPWIERRFGAWRWIAIYFLCALVGETVGAFWHPDSAGSSVGIVGLVGAFAATLFVSSKLKSRVVAIIVLIAALALTWARDIHGPPALFGFVVGYVMVRASLRVQPE